MLDIRQIQAVTGAHYAVPVVEITGPRRNRAVTFARHVAMFLACKHTRHSLPEIAAAFERKDHTSVMHARNRIAAELKRDEKLGPSIEIIETRLFNGVDRLCRLYPEDQHAAIREAIFSVAALTANDFADRLATKLTTLIGDLK